MAWLEHSEASEEEKILPLRFIEACIEKQKMLAALAGLPERVDNIAL